MAVTIRYTRDLMGHPEPGSQITVEQTDTIDFLLAQGYAVLVDPPLTDHLARARDSFDAVTETLLERFPDA